MHKIDEYLRDATDCRNIARTAAPAHRQQLEKMAETWEQLAEVSKKQLSKASGEPMANDKPKTAAERKRIDVHEDFERQYWSLRFGVTIDQLEAAVRKVGTNAEDVARELGIGTMTDEGLPHDHVSRGRAPWIVLAVVIAVVMVALAHRWLHGMPDVVAHMIVLSAALLGILFGLGGIAAWYVTRNMSNVT